MPKREACPYLLRTALELTLWLTKSAFESNKITYVKKQRAVALYSDMTQSVRLKMVLGDSVINMDEYSFYAETIRIAHNQST